MNTNELKVGDVVTYEFVTREGGLCSAIVEILELKLQKHDNRPIANVRFRKSISDHTGNIFLIILRGSEELCGLAKNISIKQRGCRMAKINKQHKWDTCIHVLCPFGRGFALCSHGMNIRGKDLSARDFPICMQGGKCLKEEAEKNKEVNAQYRKILSKHKETGGLHIDGRYARTSPPWCPRR